MNQHYIVYLLVAATSAAAVWKVNRDLEPAPATHALPPDVQRSIDARVAGKPEPHPRLVASLAADIRSSPSNLRLRLLARDPKLDPAVLAALGNGDDAVALGACAWLCAAGEAGAALARSVADDASQSPRARALALMAASCSLPRDEAVLLAREAMATNGEIALGGAFLAYRLGDDEGLHDAAGNSTLAAVLSAAAGD